MRVTFLGHTHSTWAPMQYKFLRGIFLWKGSEVDDVEWNEALVAAGKSVDDYIRNTKNQMTAPEHVPGHENRGRKFRRSQGKRD